MKCQNENKLHGFHPKNNLRKGKLYADISLLQSTKESKKQKSYKIIPNLQLPSND